jgi:hypothetical protein
MSFENPSNRARGVKIVDTLALIEKSAQSNRAGADEIAEMCAPILEKLHLIGAIAPTPSLAEAIAASEPRAETYALTSETPDGKGGVINGALTLEAVSDAGNWAADRSAPAWAIIHDAAQNAPLHQLAGAMAVFGTRVDEALADIKQTSNPKR